MELWWRSSPGYWDLVASSLEHTHNQMRFIEAVVCDHGKSIEAHVNADADVVWETISIPPDCKCVPSAAGATSSPAAGRETMPIPLDCECVSGFGITAGATDVG